MRGINGFDKRKEIFYTLRNKADIICLQETHSIEKNVNIWDSQWGKGTTIYSHGESNARGVLIHFRDGAGIELEESQTDTKG